ncbi:MAG: acylhydrolase [Lachnospiraceae bacterium]|nr:acylhydrolase [Lachnospiraceae bacterium]
MNVYASQEYDPLTAPILSVMFTGINDDIYPWHVFMGGDAQTMALGNGPKSEIETGILEAEKEEPQEIASAKEEDVSSDTLEKEPPERAAMASQTPEVTEALEEENKAEPFERQEPLRESTKEEIQNHVSADVYGDAGVLRAAEYEFSTVDESYFDDALFIGDSRTVGLRNYTDLSEHADFYCETSLTIYKVLEENFDNQGTVEEALENHDYGKIYLMVGINELGRGTTEDFMAEYTRVVDRLHELEPEAKIFVQGVMRVSGEKSSSDAIFNNSNINARNNAIATLADNDQFFYIDVNEAVCDEEGNLISEYTFDQIHLLGAYYDLWKQFLLVHGVEDN